MHRKAVYVLNKNHAITKAGDKVPRFHTLGARCQEVASRPYRFTTENTSDTHYIGA